jgi:hypothetical protein
MLWFERPKTAAHREHDEVSTPFEKRILGTVRPFLESGQLDDYQFEDAAWTVVGTRAVIWASKDLDPYSPMRNVPKFELVVKESDGSESIMEESFDLATLIQKAKAEYPAIPEVP